MIYLTGDTHAEFNRFSRKTLYRTETAAGKGAWPGREGGLKQEGNSWRNNFSFISS